MAKRDTDTGGVTMGTSHESDPAYNKFKANQENSAKAKGMLARSGYARGGGVSPIKAVHKHEGHMHKGEKKTKLKHGSKVEGKKPHHRADKFARGGSVPKGHTKININMGASMADKQDAMKKGAQIGATMMAQKMAGGARPGAGASMQARGLMPGPAPMPPGGAPPMGGGVPPTMGQKRGGRTYAKGGKVGPVRVPGVPHMDAGGGGGAGRREKMKQYGTKPKK